jgi:drug/metabolite transporter (DMT)-like permease
MQALSLMFPVLAWIIASGVFLTVADILFRVGLSGRWHYGFLLVFFVYMIGMFCMMMTFFQQNIAIATVAAVLVNIVAYLAAAYILYGDTLSAMQIVGVALGVTAIAVLELS